MHSTQTAPGSPAPGVMLPHLRAWRLARGLAVRELAERAYCSRQYIYLIESGERGIRRRLVPLIALALDVDPSTLINRAPAAPQDTTAGTQIPTHAKVRAPVMAATQ